VGLIASQVSVCGARITETQTQKFSFGLVSLSLFISPSICTCTYIYIYILERYRLGSLITPLNPHWPPSPPKSLATIKQTHKQSGCCYYPLGRLLLLHQSSPIDPMPILCCCCFPFSCYSTRSISLLFLSPVRTVPFSRSVTLAHRDPFSLFVNLSHPARKMLDISITLQRVLSLSFFYALERAGV
jgi:hypothetical protein